MSVHSKRPRQRLSKDVRREQLLAAALRAFSKGGYHSTHVDHVIREAGVARGTFYLHFKSKHEVFAALVDRMLATFLSARPVIPEPKVRTVADVEVILSNSYRAMFATFREHRVPCRLLFEEAVGIDKGFAARLAQHFAVWHERVASTFSMFVKRRVARRDLDVDVSVDLVLGMVERLTRVYLLPDREPDIERLVRAVVALEVSGIRAAR
jgi:AcrR family transcriptional regulator